MPISAPSPAVLLDPSDITPAWLTAALRSAGHEVTVAACRSEPVGTGQMAHNERIFVEYEGEAPGRPSTFVAKMPSPSPESRSAGGSGAYRAETRFYLEMADRLACVTPACLYGAISEDETTFTLLLEDLAPKQQGDQIAGASDAQIEAAVRNLAGLHAPMRGAPDLDRIDWLVGGVGDQLATYIEMATPAFVDRYHARLAPEDRETLDAFAANVKHWIARRPAARTLVHGDYRLDNLMFEATRDGVAVAAVDWQTLSIACGGQDLAYLLGNSSAPERRRAHESHMLDAYRDSMAALGVDLSADEVRAEYVYGAFQGPAITILGALAVGQTDRGDDMFMAMASRSCAQIRDLEALELIR
jgi:hypothetical protein